MIQTRAEEQSVPLYTVDEVALNEKLSIRNGNYAIVGVSIVSNFASLFALKALHATAGEIAMLNSLPALTSIIATWIGAMWLSRVQGKRMFCVRATLISRLFYVFIASMPFVLHGPLLALFVVLTIALMNFPQSLSLLSWQSLIGDLIPDERRAAFFGRRNRSMTIVGLLATLIPGLILQRFPVASIPPYQVFFLLSFLMSLLEVYYLMRHREHVVHRPDKQQSAMFHPRMLLGHLRLAPYRNFLIGTVVFNLGWQMAWPLFSLYQINDAGATAGWISAFTVANQVSQIVTFGLWSKLSARYGNTVMLAVACAGMATTPVINIVSTNLTYLTVVNLLTGTFVAGITLLQFNHLLEVVPEIERTSYIAHYNIVAGIVGFVAPEIGVGLLPFLHMNPDMILSTVVRAIGTLVFVITAWRVAKRPLLARL